MVNYTVVTIVTNNIYILFFVYFLYKIIYIFITEKSMVILITELHIPLLSLSIILEQKIKQNNYDNNNK